MTTSLMALLITLLVVNLIGAALIWYLKHHSHGH
jgi:formate/nitrite transporter FocA (FNT family)